MQEIRGKDVIARMKEEMQKELAGMDYVPRLAIVRVGERPDDMSYERGAMKRMEGIGLRCSTYTFPESVSNEAFTKAFLEINEEEDIDGILLLRPLPKHIDEKNIEKMIETRKSNGTWGIWNAPRGGNGQYTKPQMKLYNELNQEPILEYPIKTNYPRKEHLYPTCYKVDLAYPTIKLAIEVDGKGHRTKSCIEKDLKKTQFLNSIGWKVLRFTNEDIMMNCSDVVSQVKSCVENMQKCTI